MKTVKFKSYSKNISNEERSDSSQGAIDPNILRKSLETLVEMVTEMRLENKALVEQNNCLETDLANERATVNEQHQALQLLREEFETTNAHLGETLGTNHHWWSRSCELEAELNSIKGRFWWRMRDRITSLKFPFLTFKIPLSKVNMIRRGTDILLNSLNSCLLILSRVLYFSLKIVGLAYPLKALLRRLPLLDRRIRQLMGRSEELDLTERPFSVKEIFLRQLVKMVWHVGKETKFATLLRSWLNSRPLLKARLKTIVSQSGPAPIVVLKEVPFEDKAFSYAVNDQMFEADLSGLTASAKRLYKVVAKDLQGQSSYSASPFLNEDLTELTSQARRLLKNR